MATHQELAGLRVSVDRIEYIRDEQNTNDRLHRFAYYITIHNDSLRIVTITGRKWLVVNEQGHRLIIEGDGVVGQFPRLTPSDRFQYNSYHLIKASSTAEGAYLGKDEDGQNIIARIPLFKMAVPD
jgi:ApaG protein